MTELTNYEEWQINKYGNILQMPEMEIAEPGEDEARRFSEWNQLQHELWLYEHDYQYTNERM